MKKPFLKMTGEQRDIEAQKLERGVSIGQTHPLSARSEVLWNLAKRGRGRPRKPADQKVERILISIDPRLLAIVEKFASENGLDKSKLFALSVKAFIAADESHRQAFSGNGGKLGTRNPLTSRKSA